jgi:DNA-binding PadR family transcriptional regulator
MRFVFLALLSRGPVHGYEIKRLYDQLFAAVWGPINIGQIYVTMGRLERSELVIVTPDGGRKVYELTEIGRKELDSWIGTSVDPVQKSDIVLRLLAASLVSPETTAAVISDHRARCLAALRDLNVDAHGSEPPTHGWFGGLLVDHVAVHLAAELQWLDRVEQVGGTPKPAEAVGEPDA